MDEEFDIDDLRYYMSLDARAKLDYLEKMITFLHRITPDRAKEISATLEEEPES